ncbi:MAG TPA: hypothetical protein PLT47_04390, partial [Bacteroidales bacterium]|nr:hypothetical protein [Bacteroidales bacterium]
MKIVKNKKFKLNRIFQKQYTSVLLIIVMLCFSANTISAQEKLFVSKEIMKAYSSETRSIDGKPGKNYWQNSSDYKIKVKFSPETGILEGQEEITYHNNSPDTLKTLVVRLYQDMF